MMILWAINSFPQLLFTACDVGRKVTFEALHIYSLHNGIVLVLGIARTYWKALRDE
jgi:hypothetical protein